MLEIKCVPSSRPMVLPVFSALLHPARTACSRIAESGPTFPTVPPHSEWTLLVG